MLEEMLDCATVAGDKACQYCYFELNNIVVAGDIVDRVALARDVFDRAILAGGRA